MNRKMKYAFMLALLLILSDAFMAVKLAEQNIKLEHSNPDKSSVSEVSSRNSTAPVVTKQYRTDGVVAEYPMLVTGGSVEQLKQWNQIIEEDVDKILAIYSFQPVPGPARTPSESQATILRIKYEMKLNNENYVSIFYTAAFNSPTSAHPTQLVYTTNIDKAASKRMVLSDIVILNEEFVRNFRTWEYIPLVENNEEWNNAVKDYVTNISDEELLSGFQNADIIGSKNRWNIYSYLTKDRLGISLGVPNFIGDHAEFEEKYQKIKNYLRPDFKY